ncbi:MAG: hypothetical protein RR543_00560 [Erysipelotrichales bacterium]
MNNRKIIVSATLVLLVALGLLTYSVNSKFKESQRVDALKNIRVYKLSDSEYNMLKTNMLISNNGLMRYSSNSDLMINDKLIESDIDDIKVSLDKIYLNSYQEIDKKMKSLKETNLNQLDKLKTNKDVDKEKKAYLINELNKQKLVVTKNDDNLQKLKYALNEFNEQALLINDVNMLVDKLSK